MKAGTRKSSRTSSVIGRPTHKNNSWGEKNTIISKNSIGKVRGWSDAFHNSNLGGVEKQCDLGCSSASWWSEWGRARDGGVLVVVFPSPPDPQGWRVMPPLKFQGPPRSCGEKEGESSSPPSTQLSSLEGNIRGERRQTTKGAASQAARSRERTGLKPMACPVFPPAP